MKANAKPIVKYNPFGAIEGIYGIIAAAQKALARQGKDVDILTQVEEDSQDYAHALQIIMEHVQLVDETR